MKWKISLQFPVSKSPTFESMHAGITQMQDDEFHPSAYMATENFESMKALHVRISRSSVILVCHMYQLNQVDYVDF